MVRNIAQREQARDKAQELAHKIEGLKEQEAEIKTSDAPAQTKEKSLEQVREQAREIVQEAPQPVRARIPKRDRGLER
jgi:sugar-specific transcriptional regulator TrmB